VTERTLGSFSFASPNSQSILDCSFSDEGIESVNVDLVLNYSLTWRITMIRSGLSESARESASISADLERGTATFSAGHLLPFNQPDYLHAYYPYHGLSGDARSTKFVMYYARDSQNMICCMSDQTWIVLSYSLHPDGLQWSDRLWRRFNFCEEARPSRKAQTRDENSMNNKWISAETND
jgi:hypothetical protein